MASTHDEISKTIPEPNTNPPQTPPASYSSVCYAQRATVASLAEMAAHPRDHRRDWWWQGTSCIPRWKRRSNTVSTDDAYVNGHVTFVAPRVSGQVSRVLVDDNYRVKKGDLLVQLDKEPYQVQVAIKKAAVEVAETDLAAAQAQVRSLVAPGPGLSVPTRAHDRGRSHPDRQPASQRGELREPEGDAGSGAGQPETGRGAPAERGHQQGRPRPAPANGQGR